MKTIIYFLICIILTACSQLENMGKRAINETANNVASRTIRKVQNKVETKIENTIDGIGKTKPIKRKSETDSLVIKNK